MFSSIPTIDYRSFAPAMRGMAQVHAAVDSSALPASIIDLVRLRASQINGCSYCVQTHWAEARGHGLDEDILALLTTWRHARSLGARERAALRMTEALTELDSQETVEASVAEAQAVFDSSEMSALLVAVAEINAWNRLAIGGGRHAV